MRLLRFLPQRFRHLAPEAIAFGAIGFGNLVLYFLIFNALIFIGAVKATVIATLVTTYLAYLANRHWTYKDRPRRAQHREYTMFFAINMVGLLIQSAGTGLLKYGFGLSERPHRLAFNIATAVCICIATVFRFFTYRTVVFKQAPAGVAGTDDPADAGDRAAGPVFAPLSVSADADESPAPAPPVPAERHHRP